MLEMGEEKLLELMKKASNNHIDHGKARELIEKAGCAAAKKLVRIIWSVEKNKKPFQVPGNLQSS
ncbi:MAG TPA: hypothetical protein VJJ51_12375 [Candidatus Methanoperedens sp.]|nr:hypothetical protein [Candidatus Methanoperedens sp.]HLB71831.1 hypothetical protein [Candidatus Methanoperedens sp.]